MPYLVSYKTPSSTGYFVCKTNYWDEILSNIEEVKAEDKCKRVVVLSISPVDTDPPPPIAPRDFTEFRVTNTTTGAVHRFDYRSEADSFYDASVAEHGEIYGYELSILVKRHDPPEMLGVTP